ALHLHVKDIYGFLEFHLNELGTVEARDEMARLGFEIRPGVALVVIAGLGDIAGSALLLDMTYLVRYLCRRAGLQMASTGLLFMPPLAPSVPEAEACAYATLKELDACMDRHAYRCDYPGLPIESDQPPFDRGCYLIDMGNEKALRLRSQDEAARLAAEWLFRTLLTPLQGRVEEFAGAQGSGQQVQGRLAAYSSLGLAAYVLPIDELIRWSANRLSGELVLDVLLRGELHARVAAHLLDFENKTHLRPQDLMEGELRLGADGRPMQLQDSHIVRLRTVPHQQLIPAVQAALNAIRAEALPGLRQRIEANVRRVLAEMGEAVSAETAAILRSSPAGGLSLATQFMAGLRDRAAHSCDALLRQEAACQGRSQQQVTHLNQLGRALRNAVAGIPSYPVIAASLLAGLLAPLFLVSSWLWKGYDGVSGTAGVFSVAVIWLLALGGAAYAYVQTVSGIDQIRDHYVKALNDRFQTELSLTLVRRASDLYPEIRALAEVELERLDRFLDDLYSLVRTFKGRLDTAPLCGDIDFALQRSVLTAEIVEEQYTRFLGQGKADARLTPLLEQAGTLDQWPGRALEEIEAGFLSYGEQVFAGMRELKAEDLLGQQMATQMQAEVLIRGILDNAAPLWTYDPFSLGQAHKPPEQTLVGLEAPDASELGPQFAKVNPMIRCEATNDPHSLIVTTLRRGLPLFALRRMGQFSRHYLNAVKGQSLPLHIEDEMALVPDVMYQEHSDVALDAPTAFSVGAATGLVMQRDDGVYAVTDTKGKEIAELSTERLDSVILLGADGRLLYTLTGLVQAHVSEKGTADATAELKDYLAQAEIDAWEETCITRYIELLRG
nr:tubulin-like doman-containing protein [Anaerolineae bacterium]